MEKKLWTTQQVADYLNVDYMTIRSRMKDNKIPYININPGGEREVPRFDPDSIKAMK